MHNSGQGSITEVTSGDVWFVYDGDCPICRAAAQALRIKKDVGELHLVNAREQRDHPLVQEVNDLRLNLDDGMVLKYRGTCYHGQDALHMMALLGSPSGWFNRLNAMLFSSKALAGFCYPVMRAGRNFLLRLKGIAKINNLKPNAGQPLFKAILGPQWNALPPALKQHYMLRSFSDDHVVVKGSLDIKISSFMKLASRTTGLLLPYSGAAVPTTVIFRSGSDTNVFHFDRVIHFPGKPEVHFRSHMQWIGGKELIEFIGFGIGWRLSYRWDGQKIVLDHRGYVWRCFGMIIPLPLSLVLGKAYAEETAQSDDTFRMWTHLKHPLFGELLRYEGPFQIVDVSCPQAF